MHRADYAELTTKLLNLRDSKPSGDSLDDSSPAFPSDALLWPYINLEDLTKPKSLLIFLNSRGRKVRLVFAPSETVFSPLGEMSACGPEPELLKYFLRFSNDPDPTTYESVSPVYKELHEYEPDESGYEFCLRTSILTLHLQNHILSFLVKCSKLMLHDVSEYVLCCGTLQEEPCSSELELRSNGEYTTFSDSLSMAPYRDRSTIDFARL